ncbi:MAG: outer membrane protein [Labilithrix sp.]|nr:outer membrane protein [Labilithrix sp.]
MKNTIKLGLVSLTLLATACGAGTPPPELVDARAAYQRASQGPTAQTNPADLHVAKEALDQAEAQFKDDGDSAQTKDTAYVALRKTELAESRARVINAEKQRDQIAAQSQAAQAQALQTTSAQLAGAKNQLNMTAAQLAEEKSRREEAEKRAAQAAADLAKIASVKQESRGMVITLSGSVLFATAKWELLPGAKSKLDEVAKALTQQDKDSTMTVEGYTDSQGALAMNEELSQKRADSVRTYLVSRGIASDRITSKGMGPSSPVADNTSPEGRANNRRVEIVVHNGGNAGGNK